ncbi:MAG: hypothetical protein Kow00114_27340 [Kiloniellaceae bacterium]
MATTADRLRQARLKKFASAAEAARALGVNPVTYRAHENGQRGLDAETARLYAKKLGVDPGWLLLGDAAKDPAAGSGGFVAAALEHLRDEVERLPAGGSRERLIGWIAEQEKALALRQAADDLSLGELRGLPRDLHFVRVRGAVEAGAWREAVEWPQEDWFPVGVAGIERYAAYPQFGLVVRGPSMNLVYPEGSILVCVAFLHLGRDPQSGERVVVEHRRGSFVEATVKEFVVENGRARLYARSDHPRYAGAVELPAEGEPGEHQDDEIRVTALVVASIRPEPPA